LSTIRACLTDNVTSTSDLKKSRVLGFDFLLKSMVFLTLGLRFGFKRLVFLLKMLIVKLELVNFILHSVVRFMMVGKTNDRLRHAEE